MPREDFDKLTARVEEGWKRWRDDLAEAEISKNVGECDERDDLLKRKPVSRTVVTATTNAEPDPEPEPEKPKRKRRSRAKKKVEAEPEGEALFSNQTGTEC